MYLVKLESGDYRPSYPSDEKISSKIKVGAEVRATKARNPTFHRKAFALLRMGFDNQDKYDNEDIYRQVVTIKAGYVEWVHGLDGVNYPFAKSWSFEKMDAEEFEKLYSAIFEVIRKELKTTDQDIIDNLESYK